MYINQIFEFSIVLDHGEFHKVLARACDRTGYMERNEDEYIDHSLESKGITVTYRDSQYKKKIRLLFNSGLLMDGKLSDSDKLTRKMDKRIAEYFDFKYQLDDFQLSGVTLVTDINVGDYERKTAYLKVLKRIGRVKGFSPVNYEGFDERVSFCLEGNSNGIAFLLYDWEDTLMNRLKQTGARRKELKSVAEKTEGVLRAEVRLAKPKAIRAYAKSADISKQIRELTEKSKEIFMDTFTHIIPFGSFYKKDRATEIIYREVEDHVLRRKMLRLLELIPEKKSLYLAQKTMDCRNMDKIMNAFEEINVSPITISKRHDTKYLKCLYEYLIVDERSKSKIS